MVSCCAFGRNEMARELHLNVDRAETLSNPTWDCCRCYCSLDKRKLTKGSDLIGMRKKKDSIKVGQSKSTRDINCKRKFK